MMPAQPARPADLLEIAAEIVDRRGLARFRFVSPDGRVSVEGALQRAVALRGERLSACPAYHQALEALLLRLGDRLGAYAQPGRQTISAWNDHPSVAEVEVVHELRRTAAHLRSCEW